LDEIVSCINIIFYFLLSNFLEKLDPKTRSMEFVKYLNLQTNTNHVFVKMTRIFSMKKQLNIIFFVSIVGCSINILSNIIIYRKISKILDSIENKKDNKNNNKNNTDK
jgi:hypothetical protein